MSEMQPGSFATLKNFPDQTGTFPLCPVNRSDYAGVNRRRSKAGTQLINAALCTSGGTPVTVVVELNAHRADVFPPSVLAFVLKINDLGGTVVSSSRVADGFEVSWRPKGAAADFEPMIALFAAPPSEIPLDSGLVELEEATASDQAAELEILPDVEALLFGSVATIEPAMAVLVEGYARISEAPLSAPGAPIVALAARARAVRSFAAGLSTLAASFVLLDAADGALDGLVRLGGLAVDSLI